MRGTAKKKKKKRGRRALDELFWLSTQRPQKPGWSPPQPRTALPPPRPRACKLTSSCVMPVFCSSDDMAGALRGRWVGGKGGKREQGEQCEARHSSLSIDTNTPTMCATLPASTRALAPRAAPRAPVCRVRAVPRDRAPPGRPPRVPTTALPSLSCRPARPRRAPLPPRARGGDDDANLVERAASAAVYVFPLFDSIRFARFLFLAYPATRAVLIPLKPLASLYFSLPLASLVVFFGLYLGLVRNANAPRFVRYHAAQAVMLDVLLVLPGLVESVFRPPSSGLGLQLLITFSNTVAIFAAACFVAGAGGALLGKAVRLPLVADAADAQVGGY